MKARALYALVPALVVATATASAHFRLEQPADRLATNDTGDPTGPSGTQKMNPCGQGTPSGAITQVRAGGMLHVRLVETIPHGGHYRIALLPKHGITAADIPEPEVVVDGGQCISAAVQDPVVAPVVADNLFPHPQAGAITDTVWETDVPMPQELGNATLQIIEFMTPHAPQCFYHHCAELEIVAPDAAVEDGGVIIRPPDASSPNAAGDGGGSSVMPGAGGGDANVATGLPVLRALESEPTDGCNVADGRSGLTASALFAMAFAALLRKRRR